jgi:hypothetical protein
MSDQIELNDGWYVSTQDQNRSFGEPERFETHTAVLEHILNQEARTPLESTTFRSRTIWYVKDKKKYMGYIFSRYTNEFNSEPVKHTYNKTLKLHFHLETQDYDNCTREEIDERHIKNLKILETAKNWGQIDEYQQDRLTGKLYQAFIHAVARL